MKVVARQNVRDASGWHLKGQVFETEEDLGAAVDVLDGQKPEQRKAEPEPIAKEREPKAAESESAPEKAPEKPRSTSRRRSGR